MKSTIKDTLLHLLRYSVWNSLTLQISSKVEKL